MNNDDRQHYFVQVGMRKPVRRENKTEENRQDILEIHRRIVKEMTRYYYQVEKYLWLTLYRNIIHRYFFYCSWPCIVIFIPFQSDPCISSSVSSFLLEFTRPRHMFTRGKVFILQIMLVSNCHRCFRNFPFSR